MKMNFRTTLIASAALLFGLASNASFAQTRVVVIPLQGDNEDIYRGTLITGNTRCSYDDGSQWSAIACDLPAPLIDGQDAQTQYGVAATTSPRFIINNGTVEDTLTGLVWLQQAYCAAQTADWGTALQYIIELNLSGGMNSQPCGDISATGNIHQTDWRLPNVRELQTLTFYGDHGAPYLVNTNGDGQWVEANPFQSVQINAKAYWSSTTIAKRSEAESSAPVTPDDTLDDAMRVNFRDGTTDGTSKGAFQHVWAVRDKQ